MTVAMDAVDRTTVVEAAQPETTATTTTVVTATPPTTTAPATTTSSTVRPPATTTITNPPEPAAATLRPGDSGPAVSGLQARVRTLGYWLGVADGTYGHLTEQAVMAFQKVESLSPDGVAGPGTQAALADARRPVPRGTGGDRMEVDKARQVVLIVRDGRAAWTLNTSTGTEEALPGG